MTIKIKKSLLCIITAIFLLSTALGILGIIGNRSTASATDSYTLTFTGGRGDRDLGLEEEGNNQPTWFRAINGGTKEIITDGLSPEDRNGTAVKYENVSNNDEYLLYYMDVTPRTAGNVYTSTFWMKTVQKSGNFEVRIWDADDATVLDVKTGERTTLASPFMTIYGTTEWTRYEITWTPTVNTSAVRVRATVWSGTGEIYIDEVGTYQSQYAVTAGNAITTLPKLPTRDGHAGVWVIDNEIVTASTVYNYGADKTAKVSYTSTLSFGTEDLTDSLTASDLTRVTGGDVITAFELDTENAYSGTAVRYAVNGTGNIGATMVFNGVSVTKDESYTISFKARFTDKAGTLHLGQSLNKNANATNIKTNITVSTTWVTYTATFTAAHTQSDFIFDVIIYGAADRGAEVLIDDIRFIYAGSKTVYDDVAIGTLPDTGVIPAKSGYRGYWGIDGEEISSATLYGYVAENKVATPFYKQLYTLSFETADLTDYVTDDDLNIVYTATGIETVTENAYSGKAINIVTDNVTSNSATTIVLNGASVVGGNSYTLRFKARYTDANGYIHLGNSASANSAAVNIATNKAVTTSWGDFSYTFTASNTQSNFILCMMIAQNSGGKNLLIDDIHLAVSGSTVADDEYYCIGDTLGDLPETPSVSGYRGVWTIDGEEISSSTVWSFDENKTALPVYDKLYTLSFETADLTDYVTDDDLNIVYTATGIETVTENAYSGKAINIVTDNVTSNSATTIVLNGASVVGGNSYTLRFKARYTDANGYIHLGNSASANSAAVNIATNKAVTTSWGDFSYTFTASNTQSNFILCMMIAQGSGGKNLLIDDVRLTLPVDNNVQFCVGDLIEESLPGVPSISDHHGAWSIDGIAVNSSSVWTYTTDKVAVAEYEAVYVLHFGTEDLTENLSAGDLTRVTSGDVITALELDTENAYSGTAVKFAVNDEDNKSNIGATMVLKRTAITTGLSYTISFKARFTDKAGKVHIGNSASRGAGSTNIQPEISVSTTWETYTYTFTAAYTQSDFIFCVMIYSASGRGTELLIDDLHLIERDCIVAVDDVYCYVGETIGTLPTLNVGSYDGYYFTIDGEIITSETVWNYSSDKIAIVHYYGGTKLYFGTVDLTDTIVPSLMYPISSNVSSLELLEGEEEGAYSGLAINIVSSDTSERNTSASFVFLDVPVVMGESYTITFRARFNDANGYLHIGQLASYEWKSGQMTWIKTNQAVTTSWVQYSYTFDAVNALDDFALGIAIASDSTGADILIDDLHLLYAGINPIDVTYGEEIGTLPSAESREGYRADWVLDGERLISDYVYDRYTDAYAQLVYKKLYTLTFGETGIAKQLAIGDEIGTLADIEDREDYFGFWKIDDTVLSEDTVWSYDSDKTATVSYTYDLEMGVGITTVQGAFVRVNTEDNKSGIRFETHISYASYNALVAKFGEENVETGTYILPFNYLNGRLLYAYVTDANNVDGVDYVKIVNQGFMNRATAASDGYYKYSGSLVNIKAKNYSANFIGMGYVSITVDEDETVLVLAGEADIDNSRSIYSVAYSAYLDEDNDLDDDQLDVLVGYLDRVAVLESSSGYGAPTISTALSDSLYTRSYTPSYYLTQSATTGNWIIENDSGKTINAIILDNVMYSINTPAETCYFSYYLGSATILASDEASRMSATISTANHLKNGVQGVYDDEDWTSYTVSNQNMSLTHGLTKGNIKVSSLTNSQGDAYLTNTLDAYVVYSGAMVYGQTGANTYGSSASNSAELATRARVNVRDLGYYYYDVDVADIIFSNSIPLYLKKTYHTYGDKLHQEFTVVASGTTSNVTALGFEMKIPKSDVAKYVIDGTTNSASSSVSQYVGFDITGVGVVGIIVAGDSVTVTFSSDSTYYYVRQQKAMSTLTAVNTSLTPYQKGVGVTSEWKNNAVALTSSNYATLYNRLYTDETHTFTGIAAANTEEQNPFDEENISVTGTDASFKGYDYAFGAYKFAIKGAGFGTSYANPERLYTETISLTGITSDRTIYVRAESTIPMEGAAVVDATTSAQLPIPVQVGKNFSTEYEEPIFDPTDIQYGFMVLPIQATTTDCSFTLVNAMQNWGNFAIKQLSSISYYVGYYHLSTGVTETDCIAPYFSYNCVDGSYNRSWILPDFRGHDGVDSEIFGSDPQKDTVGNLLGVSNGATISSSTPYGSDLGIYLGSEIKSSGLTYADVEYSYVAESGNYTYTYRHVEMPQQDEARTYYTLTVTFNNNTTINNKQFNLFGFTSWHGTKYSKFVYRNTSGNPVPGNCPTSYTSTQAIYSLYKGASYFALYGVNDTSVQTGNFGLIVKSYSIVRNGRNYTGGLAFKNGFVNGMNFCGLTLANTSTYFYAGDSITVNVILLPFDKSETDYSKVLKVFNDSAVNPLTVTAATGTVISDTYLATVRATNNVAQFTVSGGYDTTNAIGATNDGNAYNSNKVIYAVRVSGITKIAKPTIQEYVNGEWIDYDYENESTAIGGYTVEQADDGTLTYSFVIEKDSSDRTFKLSFS